MVEDALKATRNLHRLIITVSLVTIVFSLSLKLPGDKVEQLKAIQQLIDFPFKDYDQYVVQRTDEFAARHLAAIGKGVNRDLVVAGLTVFNLHHIGEGLGRPLHVGRIKVADTILANLGTATLAQLRGLETALEIGRDLQIPIPVTNGLVEAIVSDLEELPSSGHRVDNLRFESDYSHSEILFIDETNATWTISFEAIEPIRTGGVPVTQASFDTRIASLTHSSFRSWLLAHEKTPPIVTEQNDSLRWLPGLTNFPAGFADKPFAELMTELSDEIRKGGPEERSVSLLGTNVPGILFVYAAPLSLLALTYFLLNHAWHLHQLSQTRAEDFAGFAWMPLALERKWEWELAWSLLLLPVGSLIVLYVRLRQLGDLNAGPTVVLALGVVGLLYMAVGIFEQVGRIRTSLGKPNEIGI